MDRVKLLKRWQTYNPQTGTFDVERTNREYANLLGMHESQLSKVYSGASAVGMKLLVGLARAFPAAATEATSALIQGPALGEPDEGEVA